MTSFLLPTSLCTYWPKFLFDLIMTFSTSILILSHRWPPFGVNCPCQMEARVRLSNGNVSCSGVPYTLDLPFMTISSTSVLQYLIPSSQALLEKMIKLLCANTYQIVWVYSFLKLFYTVCCFFFFFFPTETFTYSGSQSCCSSPHWIIWLSRFKLSGINSLIFCFLTSKLHSLWE